MKTSIEKGKDVAYGGWFYSTIPHGKINGYRCLSGTRIQDGREGVGEGGGEWGRSEVTETKNCEYIISHQD